MEKRQFRAQLQDGRHCIATVYKEPSSRSDETLDGWDHTKGNLYCMVEDSDKRLRFDSPGVFRDGDMTVTILGPL